MTPISVVYAVSLMVVSLTAVFLVSWRWTGSIRSGFMISLILGHLWAGVLLVFGVNVPVFYFVYYLRHAGRYGVVEVGADQLILAGFFSTLVITLAWPWIEPILPESARSFDIGAHERK